MCGKLEVSVQKILKYFSQCSGVGKAVEEIMQNKNWQSAWLLMKEDMYLWFMIHQIFWKTRIKVNPVVISKDQHLDFYSDDLWVRNYLYNLKNENKIILISKVVWHNEHKRSPNGHCPET